jgi:type I restriction enzyme R subunit
LNTRAKRALYDNLGNNEQLALALDATIQRTKKDGWRGNKIKERELQIAIRAVLGDKDEAARIFALVAQQSEY